MRKNNLLVSLVLLIVLLTGQVVFAETNEVIFSDVKEDHWAYKSIYEMFEEGIVNGYPDGTFKPDNSITRAEFIKMIVIALDLPTEDETSPWYSVFVDVAVVEKLHELSDFSSDYNDVMPRMEMVRIAVRAIVQGEIYPLNDEAYMLEAVSNGIINGMGNGRLAPDGLTTRAQALTVIERVLQLREGNTLPIDEQALLNAQEAYEENLETNVENEPTERPKSPAGNNMYGNVEFIGKGNLPFSFPMHDIARALMIELIESIELVNGYIHLTVPNIPNPFTPGINEGYNIGIRYNDQTNAENEFQSDQTYNVRVAQSGSKHEIPYNNGVGFLWLEVGEVLANDYPVLESVFVDVPTLQMTSSTEGW